MTEHILQRERVNFYHATGLLPLREYCKARAVLSRKALIDTGAHHASFHSDAPDRVKGILDRTFGNLADLSYVFWSGSGGTPNVYGPIMLVFEPRVWALPNNIAVTRRSAAHPEFDLATDTIPEADLQNMLCIRGTKVLPTNPFTEVSVDLDRLPFSHVAYAVVDPIDPKLVGEVQTLLTGAGLTAAQVKPRRMPGGAPLLPAREGLFTSLLEWAAYCAGTPPPDLEGSAPPELRDWVASLTDGAKHALFRWLEYTYVDALDCR